MIETVWPVAQRTAQVFDLGEIVDPLPDVPDRMQDHTPAVIAFAVKGEPDCPRSDLLCFTYTADENFRGIAEIHTLRVFHDLYFPTLKLSIGRAPHCGNRKAILRPHVGRRHVNDTEVQASSENLREIPRVIYLTEKCGGGAPEISRRRRRRAQGRVGVLPRAQLNFLPRRCDHVAVSTLAVRSFSRSAAFSFQISDLFKLMLRGSKNYGFFVHARTA